MKNYYYNYKITFNNGQPPKEGVMKVKKAVNEFDAKIKLGKMLNNKYPSNRKVELTLKKTTTDTIVGELDDDLLNLMKNP